MQNSYKILLIFLIYFISCTNTEKTSSDTSSIDSSKNIQSESSKSTQKEVDYTGNDSFEYNNKIYDEDIHTVQLHPSSNPMGYPVIPLNSGRLLLQFDDFHNQVVQYKYQVVFCNQNWEPADIPELQYKGGFGYGFIDDYSYSLNTYQSYIHYKLTFPNSLLQLKLPGNYLLIVYKDNSKKPIFTQRFYVYQNKVSVQASIHKATFVQESDYNHEIDFTVGVGNLNIRDPFSDVMPVLMQNFRNDNKITGLKPVFVKANELVYDLDKENNFPGGNEFRAIDLSSEKYLAEGIQRISMDKDFKRYHFHLYPDKVNAYKAYLSEQDLDGKYVIRNENSDNNSAEADYVFVSFKLNYPMPENNGNMYIIGAFNDWQYNEKNKMYYDYAKQAYTVTLYLKQGYYDYAYAFLPDNSKEATFKYTEGDHFETGNTYQIFIYTREITKDYDALVGFKNIKFH